MIYLFIRNFVAGLTERHRPPSAEDTTVSYEKSQNFPKRGGGGIGRCKRCPYVCEAYNAEPLYKGMVSGTVTDRFERSRTPPLRDAISLKNARLRGTVTEFFAFKKRTVSVRIQYAYISLHQKQTELSYALLCSALLCSALLCSALLFKVYVQIQSCQPLFTKLRKYRAILFFAFRH